MTSAVAFVQRHVPHYREAFFSGLHEQLGRDGVSLDVLIGPAEAKAAFAEPDHPWLSTIRVRRVAVSGRELLWQDAVRATAAHDLVITELSPRIVSNFALVARARLGGPPVAGFGHGRNFGSSRLPGRATPHGLLARYVDWWFAYNDFSKDAVASLGFPPERITAVNNTIDATRLQETVDEQRREGMTALRRRLGLEGAPVAIFCGSLHERKRLSFLFEATVRLREAFRDLAVIVVGDGPCAADVETFASVHTWVHHVGRQIGGDRAKYLAVADVMLMPGLVGLVLIDSFAARVPLITTDWPFHSPEIDYLRHGENGWRSADTLDSYVAAVTQVLRDDELRARLQRGCAEAARRYTLEHMILRFSDGIVAALGHRKEETGIIRPTPLG